MNHPGLEFVREGDFNDEFTFFGLWQITIFAILLCPYL